MNQFNRWGMHMCVMIGRTFACYHRLWVCCCCFVQTLNRDVWAGVFFLMSVLVIAILEC